MYYPCSESKDADQLRGYREADLRLCFRPCKLLVFSRTGSNVVFITCARLHAFELQSTYKIKHFDVGNRKLIYLHDVRNNDRCLALT